MTSVSAWNDMMDQFITELEKTFPEEKSIKKYHTSFDLLRKSNPRKCVDAYMAEVGPYQEKIMAKDESFFLDGSCHSDFLNEINIKKYWTPELSENTKGAIWQYLQTLYILGTTISIIPPDAMNMIEDVASKCANNIQNGGQIDEKALTGLFSSLGNMLGQGQEKK